MRRTACLFGVTMLLVACNRQPQVKATNASVAEVAEKVREASSNDSFVRPGLWQSKVTVDQLDMPGMPPEMAQKMKSTMASNQQHEFQSCLTQADVKQPKEDFFAGKNNQCRYDHFSMGGGKIDALMHCGSDGTGQTMQMTGAYSPESYQMQMSSKVDAGGPGGAGMTMRMHVEAHRVGECTGQKG